MKTKTALLLFVLLLVSLIFEGILRKVVPGGIGRFIFLAKDLVVISLAFTLLGRNLPTVVRPLLFLWIGLAIALLPSLFLTAARDPILAVFGAKQYLLFPLVTLAFVSHFGARPENENFVLLAKALGLSILVVIPVAIIQLFLPGNHWLNLGVGGADLSAFSAGGRLRVTATFPFVAQFAWYLVAALPAAILCIFAREQKGLEKWLFHGAVLLSLLLIGNFATASRAAVIVSAGVIVTSGAVVVLRGHGKAIQHYLGYMLGIVALIIVMRMVVPQAFEGYIARTGGEGLHSAEQTQQVLSRLDHNFTSWRNAHFADRVGFWGIGLGTMSNGVQTFSAYAREIRSTGFWGETDMLNTYIEGGYYLLFIWMSFRLAVIGYCFFLLMQIQQTRLFYIGSVFFGYVLVNGLMSTLGIQPPLSIWFWWNVGFLLVLHQYDARLPQLLAARRQRTQTRRTQQRVVPTR